MKQAKNDKNTLKKAHEHLYSDDFLSVFLKYTFRLLRFSFDDFT